MPLQLINPGKEVILSDIMWGERLKRKLQDMGLTPGVKFKVICGNKRGPFIIDIRGTRLALGRGIVSKIQVEELNL